MALKELNEIIESKELDKPSSLSEIIESYELDKPSSWLVIREERETNKGVITWNVNKSQIESVKKIGKRLKSPNFELGPKICCSSLCISLYPCGYDVGSEDYMSVHISFDQKPIKGTTVKVMASLVDVKGEKLFAKKISEFKEKFFAWNVADDFFLSKDALEKFLSSGQLTIRCVIEIKSRLTECVSDKDSYKVHSTNEIGDLQRSMLENETLSDVKLITGTEKISAHKAILAAKCVDFKILFKASPEEDVFNIQDCESNVLKKLINFIYTNDIPDLNFRDACNLFVAADNYGIWELKEICSAYLGANLTTRNVFVVQMLANKHQDLALKSLCIDFVKKCNTETLAKDSVIVNA